MNKKIVFKDNSERTQALLNNSHLRLIEEADHLNENYLLFTDQPEGSREKSFEERVAELEGRVSALEGAAV